MAGVTLEKAIQVYASPAEFAGWIREWVDRYKLHYLLAGFFFHDEPPKFMVCQSVAWDDPSAVAQVVRDYSQLYVSVVPLNADVKDINRLAVVNRDRFDITPPELTVRGLTPATFGSVCEVPESLKVYRRIARDLLARSEKGVWFRLEESQEQTLDRRFRFAPGAALLLDQGIPFSGGGRVLVARFGVDRREVMGAGERYE